MNQMSNRVAVVYLARVAEGIDNFSRFANSYRRHRAGYIHTLYMVVKGVLNPGQRVYLKNVFKDIDFEIISIPDIGFDINAYLYVSKNIIKNELVVFCNTHTEILTENWLAKLVSAMALPRIGMVGATASYESISISQKLIYKAIWLANRKKIRFDEDLYGAFRLYMDESCRNWVKSKRFSQRLKKARIIKELVTRGPELDEFEDEHDSYWASMVSNAGLKVPWLPEAAGTSTLTPFRLFPYFPNPHIRSNCFLVERKTLNDMNFRLDPVKIDCNLFESGPHGLSRRLLRQGRRLVVVGADGQTFDVDEWSQSGTFRLGDQSNLLAGDNQTRAFMTSSERERNMLRVMTWGDYIDSQVPERIKLGLSFQRDERALAGLPYGAPRSDYLAAASKTGPRFSIVIPTHNRLALVADAIETVRANRTHDWELVVFDNCSEEPLRAHIASLDDARIRFFRSDQFLPVTESWNQAIAHAGGEYILLIGDDDGLAPNFFADVEKTIGDFDEPDCIYCSFYQFFHPGVAPWQRDGYVAEVRSAFFFSGREEPFLLQPGDRLRAINGSLRLRRNFAFNMQGLVIKRSLVSKVTRDGRFFHTPFPDYYIANMIFGVADSIVAHPRPLTIAGVSRQSFGYTLFNNLEEKGAKLLGTNLEEHASFARCKAHLLPGPAYNSNYIATMQHVRDQLAHDGLADIDFQRYRRRQIASFIPESSKGLDWLKEGAAKRMWENLSTSEKLWTLRLSYSKKKKREKKRQYFYTRRVRRLNDGGFSAEVVVCNVGGYTTTLEVYEALKSGKIK